MKFLVHLFRMLLFCAPASVLRLHNMKQEQIDRINELYHKSQAVGLTDAEKEEQAALRKQYVADIKASLRGHLNKISIVEKDGSVTDLGKKYGNVGKTES